MNPVWRFKSVEWNENGTNVELTISGKQFAKLMDLCFFKWLVAQIFGLLAVFRRSDSGYSSTVADLCGNGTA